MNFTSVERVHGKYLPTLDLQSNPLHIFISDNDLVGEIPSTICNSSSLVILDLSMNKLGGVIPSCLGNFSYLSVLDLRMNNFVGKIPPVYPEGGILRSLNLNGNQLEGSIPRSLSNCKRLEVLDLGNNGLIDTFPYWLGWLPNLHVLVLRSNRFHGGIQDFNATFSFSSLRMIDLSLNEFTGRLSPALFHHFKAMRDIQENKTGPSYMGDSYYSQYYVIRYYHDSTIVTMKGLEMKLERILTILTVIDFSCNHFQGPIPEAVGELNSLIVLNFSHNSLTGNIPTSLGKMAALESLDLSSNKLQGRIPKQLTDLSFLGALNLSQNNLEGPIPQASHFDTFSNDSFDGNSGLCGFPLSKKCGNDVGSESPPSTIAEDHESETALFWSITAMGYGCGLVFGLSMGYVFFTTGRPRWLAKMIKRNPQKRSRTRIHRNGRRRN
ncbi:putative Leucine-rich repeat protein kinase family protein [Hibiscus syriacus]|uniref:Leucine-rich repeat protein kinase family protein n=1 Tax=Hibiscus syriacus TaxID=106335 RepID=A0A6A3ADP8_HIBSY|nr:putative Leucine-rich repeat protein kinase family protein [Hibiscus syriacus]